MYLGAEYRNNPTISIGRTATMDEVFEGTGKRILSEMCSTHNPGPSFPSATKFHMSLSKRKQYLTYQVAHEGGFRDGECQSEHHRQPHLDEAKTVSAPRHLKIFCGQPSIYPLPPSRDYMECKTGQEKLMRAERWRKEVLIRELRRRQQLRFRELARVEHVELSEYDYFISCGGEM